MQETRQSIRNLKPDLVIYNPDRLVLVDVQVINDQFSFEEAHKNKVSEYQCLRDRFMSFVLRPVGFQCSTLTVNWRGVFAEPSCKELVDLGVIKKDDIKILASRTFIGAIHIHRVFQYMTSTKRR